MSAQLLPELALREATAPPERREIARDAVRMLVTDRGTGDHQHAHFYDLPAFVRPGDLFVVNDSATLPAALRATRENGNPIGLHVSTMIDAELFMIEPRASASAGETLLLEQGGRATLLAPVVKNAPRLWYARFDLPLPMYAYLAKVGEPIRYGYVKERFPLGDYQTIFARTVGSAEMPSAARPFTETIVRNLRRGGVKIASITLHCGVSSFEVPEIPAAERFIVSPETAALVNTTRANGGRVIAVGTTVVRALESAVHANTIIASSGWTSLVVEATHVRKAVDGLVTGFHAPTATHVSMLRSFLPDDQLAQAYDQAARGGYYCRKSSATFTRFCESFSSKGVLNVA